MLDGSPEVYVNNTDTHEVLVLNPQRSQKLYNHSPDGFEWGYGGSGPAQLALALLLDAGVDEADALEQHQAYKFAVVARLPKERWSIGDYSIREWSKQHKKGQI